jgi:hypothetical protein
LLEKPLPVHDGWETMASNGFIVYSPSLHGCGAVT